LFHDRDVVACGHAQPDVDVAPVTRAFVDHDDPLALGRERGDATLKSHVRLVIYWPVRNDEAQARHGQAARGSQDPSIPSATSIRATDPDSSSPVDPTAPRTALASARPARIRISFSFNTHSPRSAIRA
jgi:hypothetical protein